MSCKRKRKSKKNFAQKRNKKNSQREGKQYAVKLHQSVPSSATSSTAVRNENSLRRCSSVAPQHESLLAALRARSDDDGDTEAPVGLSRPLRGRERPKPLPLGELRGRIFNSASNNVRANSRPRRRGDGGEQGEARVKALRGASAATEGQRRPQCRVRRREHGDADASPALVVEAAPVSH